MPTIAHRTFVLVGVGGLGSPLALALAGSGAGRLILVDDDRVDDSNLQRQILYRLDDVGQKKALAARDALIRRGVPASRVEAVPARFDASTAPALLATADVVCEGSDDLATKFFVNDVCVALGRPFVIAAAIRDVGHVFPVRPGTSDPCYRCLFESPPDAELLGCDVAGIFGATCGRVAALQARCALALATGADPAGVLGKMWQLERDAFRAIEFDRRRFCEACASPVSRADGRAAAAGTAREVR